MTNTNNQNIINTPEDTISSKKMSTIVSECERIVNSHSAEEIRTMSAEDQYEITLCKTIVLAGEGLEEFRQCLIKAIARRNDLHKRKKRSKGESK